MTTKHPAKFSDVILGDLAALTALNVIRGRVLDPFAGSGRIHELADRYHLPVTTTGVELEPEWAAMHPRTLVGDARDLPFDDATFDTVATSPAYGNRFADSYDGRDGSRRMTYRLALGRPLSRGSGAALHFGDEYQRLHLAAWVEVRRVLAPEGSLVLNVSNFVRDGVEVDVAGWHVDTLDRLGFTLLDKRPIATPRMRHGANHEARVAAELVLVFVAPPADADLWTPELVRELTLVWPTPTTGEPMELDPDQHTPPATTPTDTTPKPARLTFAEELAGLARGTINDEATAALYDLVDAVSTLEKAGTLTIKVKVEPAGSGRRTVTVSGEVTTNPPKPAPELSIRFVGDGGSLHTDDPYAGRLPGVPYRDLDGAMKVTGEDGTVRRLVIEEPTLPTPIADDDDAGTAPRYGD